MLGSVERFGFVREIDEQNRADLERIIEQQAKSGRERMIVRQDAATELIMEQSGRPLLQRVAIAAYLDDTKGPAVAKEGVAFHEARLQQRFDALEGGEPLLRVEKGLEGFIMAWDVEPEHLIMRQGLFTVHARNSRASYSDQYGQVRDHPSTLEFNPLELSYASLGHMESREMLQRGTAKDPYMYEGGLVIGAVAISVFRSISLVAAEHIGEYRSHAAVIDGLVDSAKASSI